MKFIFLNFYIPLNTIFESLYMLFGWERDHQLNTYATLRTNPRGKSDFSLQKLVSFFKVNVSSLCFLLKPYESPQELPNNLWYKNLGNGEMFKTVYLSFNWLSYSGSLRFELVTRGVEFTTRGFELANCWFELVTSGFKLGTREFELITRKFEPVTCEFNLVDLNSHFWISTLDFKLSSR